MEHNPCVPSPDGLSVALGSLPVGQTERQPSQKFERRKAEPAQQNGRTPSSACPRKSTRILKFCEQNDLTASEATRRLIREAARLGPTFSGAARAEIVLLTRQLRAVGVNLNQAVHHMNAGNIVQGEDMKAWLISANDVIVELDEQYKSLCRRAHQRAKEAVCAGAT